MANYFEVTIRYQKMMENGTVKNVRERYLAEALSLTEAESIVTSRMQPFISGDFLATSAKTTKIAETCGDNGCGRFFLAKVAFITIDEKTAKEKKSVSQILIGAEDFSSAYNSLLELMRPSMADWELMSLAETQYMDLFC